MGLLKSGRKKYSQGQTVTREILQTKKLREPTQEVQFGIDLAQKIADRIYLGSHGFKERFVPIDYISNDYSYTSDRIAEITIETLFEQAWEEGYMYAYISEERGLVLPPSEKAEWIYMIDPIDGSKLHNSGAENATITMVGIPGNIENPTFSDVKFGVTLAIKENKLFYTKFIDNEIIVLEEYGRSRKKNPFHIPVRIKSRDDWKQRLPHANLVYESYSLSPTRAGIVVEQLVKRSSEHGTDEDDDGVSFKTEFPSGSYGLLTLITGRNDLYVDMREILLRYRDKFKKLVINKHPKGATPMDVAAGWFMLKALGGKMTDGEGKDLDNRPLWKFTDDGRWSEEIQISVIAAVTPNLHAAAFEKLQEGLADFKKLAPLLEKRRT